MTSQTLPRWVALLGGVSAKQTPVALSPEVVIEAFLSQVGIAPVQEYCELRRCHLHEWTPERESPYSKRSYSGCNWIAL